VVVSQTLNGLKRSVVCTTEGVAATIEVDGVSALRKSAVAPYSARVLDLPAHCNAGWSDCNQQFCYDALQSGAADAWLDDANLLHGIALEHCTDVAEVPGPPLKIQWTPTLPLTRSQLGHSLWYLNGILQGSECLGATLAYVQLGVVLTP
jgi:hypothetical protein